LPRDLRAEAFVRHPHVQVPLPLWALPALPPHLNTRVRVRVDARARPVRRGEGTPAARVHDAVPQAQRLPPPAPRPAQVPFRPLSPLLPPLRPRPREVRTRVHDPLLGRDAGARRAAGHVLALLDSCSARLRRRPLNEGPAVLRPGALSVRGCVRPHDGLREAPVPAGLPRPSPGGVSRSICISSSSSSGVWCLHALLRGAAPGRMRPSVRGQGRRRSLPRGAVPPLQGRRRHIIAQLPLRRRPPPPAHV
jgi:hypothetical protein